MSSPPSPESPTFSIVFTSPEGKSAVLHDFPEPAGRAVSFQPTLPRPSLKNAGRRGGRGLRSASSGSLRSLDSRQEAGLAYKVIYGMEDMHELEDDPCTNESESQMTATSSMASVMAWLEIVHLKLRAIGQGLARCMP